MRNKYDFINVATASFEVAIGNVEKNTTHIINLIEKAVKLNVELVLFPELSISGYTCSDMFLRTEVAENSLKGLTKIIESTKNTSGDVKPVIAVSLPVRKHGKLFNCNAFVQDGKLLALVPKTYLPNYNEFYEKRWFASSLEKDGDTIVINGQTVPFTTDVIIESETGMAIACEICEDLWVENPPSSTHCTYGANVIVNPSASNEIVTKRDYRTNLVSMQSAKCNCAYLYASAGIGESTTDVVYSGHHLICQTGSIVKNQTQKFNEDELLVTALIDIEKIENDRVKLNSYRPTLDKKYTYINVCTTTKQLSHLPSYVNPYPFIPSDLEKRTERCKEIMEIQALGLATRLKKINCKKTVIGISGGLDSTLALLVMKEAYDLLGYPYSDIIAITMPGFGTSKQTKSSADRLMEAIGVTSYTIDITEACKVHMKDIGQPEDLYDVTYENVQARERTQILMDMANKTGGIVVGTGDLSELALGWCTYNGDHMSMYAVNVSVPKTLVRFIIETYGNNSNPFLKQVLEDICNTTISPELIPPDENGNIAQDTEAAIGKYDLHDFFLYNYIRNGFGKEKIKDLAVVAFKPLNIGEAQISETLDTFIRRFRTNQFKRSCLPDGPKVGSVALSPRGDWRMPSDYQG